MTASSKSNVEAWKVVSKPAAALEVVELTLAPTALRALTTNLLRLGPR